MVFCLCVMSAAVQWSGSVAEAQFAEQAGWADAAVRRAFGDHCRENGIDLMCS